MFKTLLYITRLVYIGFVFYRHGIISIFAKPHIKLKSSNLAAALEVLGPAFIKFGQFLATRPDLIGIEVAESLSYLRDKLPSFDYQLVRKIIKKEFGKELEMLFNSFDSTPIAAASIAQVHKATTVEGEEVAVKIRRPNIDKILQDEVKFFFFIAKLLEKLLPKYKRLKFVEVVKTLEESFKFELDLSFEAAAAAELKEKNKLDYVYIPKIDWLRTSTQVLTMEYIEAISIYEQDKLLELNIDLKQLASNFAVMFFSHAFVNGFFHADLHQGNIMVSKTSQIILLDFGIMGRLDYNNRIYIAKILHGFLERNYDLIAKIHVEAGYLNHNFLPEYFAQACRAIGEPIMNLSPEQISIARLLGQLFKITEDFQMETQPQLIFLQKTMIMVEGLGKILCPNENLWILAEPWIRSWGKENISVEANAAKLIKKLAFKILAKIKHEL